jgi:hypothetical protein
MPPRSKINRESLLSVLAIFILAAAGSLRIWTIDGTMWDDNAWLMSIYSTNDLQGFLDTGFVEARRVPLGVFLYGLFWLHKNTELYYVAWHGLNVVTQMGTPFLIYLTIRKLFPEPRLLAFFVAATFAAISLDQTLPYAAAINYRIGLLLGVASFYLTACALMHRRHRVLLSLASLAAAFIAYGVFMEAVVALEPGRLLMVIFVLRSQQRLSRQKLLVAGLKWWLPYLLISIPYIAYKLLNKPYGIYAGVYESNMLFWLNWQDDINLLAYLFLFQWLIFLEYLKQASAASVLLGIGVMVFLAVLFIRFKNWGAGSSSKPAKQPKNRRRTVKETLLLGLALMIPSVLLFQYVGRPITWGVYSSHGAVAQFGYAVIIGALLTAGYYATGQRSRWKRVVRAGVPLFFGAGVFFSNLNIDLYRYAHQQEGAFWRAFLERFPTLPEKAIFLFDVRNDSLYRPTYYYDYELPLNLLYARNASPSDFRRYLVSTAFDIYVMRDTIRPEHLVETYIARHSWWGRDVLYPSQFIAVHYDGERLLVNREIIEAYPATPYRPLLNKEPPVWPEREMRYPFRPKISLAD